MASSFAIQAPTSNLTLDPDRRGAARFNVSSTTQRPLRGQLTLKPLEGVDPSWLQLEGDGEREFAGPGPQAVTVRIKVPPEARAGAYKFRLDAHSVANPDDDFVEGPTVVFSVEDPVTIPWWRKWWAIAGVAAVVLLALGGGIWALLPSKVVVPQDLVGKTFDDAKRQLEGLGLVAARTDAVDNAKPENSVKDVSPIGVLKKGATVTLTVAQHKTELPAVAQLAGPWDSNIRFKYAFSQNGSSFTWRVTSPIVEEGSGTIDANGVITARWSGANGSGGGRAKVALSDEHKMAQVLHWENGVVMWRGGGLELQPVHVQQTVRRLDPGLVLSVPARRLGPELIR